MTMQKKTFFGIGAKLVPGSMDPANFSIVAHMYQGHNPNPTNVNLQIGIDLTKTPMKGPWDQIEVDDRGYNYKRQPLTISRDALGNLLPVAGVLVTTVGPRPAPLDEPGGGVYLE